MALSEEEVETIAERVLHGAQERYVTELMESAVDRFAAAARGLPGGGTAEAMLEQLARDWPRAARRIMAEYADAISEEVREEVGDALSGSAAADEAALVTFSTAAAAQAERFAAMGLSDAFTARAEAAADGVAEIVRRQNVLMEESAERLWYDVCEDAVNRAVLGTATTDEIIAKAVARLGDIGYIAYGRDGQPTVTNMADVAVRRHVATQTAQAGGRLTIGVLDSYGHDLVITDAHWGARPEHAEWQGRPCALHGAKEVDGVKYPDIRNLTGYGTVTGLQGANCKHSINPYYPGVTPLPDRGFEDKERHFGMTSREYYDATQKQRAWERRIRKTKREIAALERADIGLESPVYVQKRLVLGRQQAALAQHCEQNKLVRQPGREKAYGVSKQPRALRKNPLEGPPSSITRPDVVIPKSLSAAAYRDKVLLSDGSYGKVTQGTRITGVKTIAGKGVRKRIDSIDWLVDKYGGKPGEWEKRKGYGYVDDPLLGFSRPCELHWYEENGRRVDMRVKRFFV